MVRYRRNLTPGGTFFFTVALANRRSTQLTSSIAHLRTAFRTNRAQHPFTIDAIVILPDHLHAIFTLPDNDADFPLRWRLIKTQFTRALANGTKPNLQPGGGYTVWQRRYWEHTIRDTTDFNRHVDYIHYNPVKHGYVANPTDWAHSLIHRYIRQSVLPPDWGKAAAEGSVSQIHPRPARSKQCSPDEPSLIRDHAA